MKFCDNCGQGNADDAAFCQQCGTSVVPVDAEGAPPEGAFSPPAGSVPPPPGMPTPPPGVPGMPPPGYAMPPRKQTDGMAVASLILGISGFFFCALLGVLAVIFGYMGRTNIRESGGALEGDSFCTAGIILGFIQIGLVIFVALIWAVIAIIAATSSASALVMPTVAAAGLLAAL